MTLEGIKKKISNWFYIVGQKLTNVSKDKDSNETEIEIDYVKLFWIFFIGCLLGVLVENLWNFTLRGYFETRRGLLYGPFNLVYGFGAVCMTIGVYGLKNKSNANIFFWGSIIGAGFEYLCSFIQEMIFGTVSWVYTLPLSIGGRTNILYAFLWGFLALFWAKVLYPLISKLIDKFRGKDFNVLTNMLMLFMVFNITMSGMAVYRWAERRTGIQAKEPIQSFFDEQYPDSKMKEIYPKMTFLRENNLKEI